MTAQAVESQPLYHSPLGLFEFQADGAARTYWQWTEGDLPVMLALWDTGIGKALAHGERVATPLGWKRIEDFRPGDPLFGVDGEVHQVVAVHPQGERDLYQVTFTDGVGVVCDRDHLWNVNTRKRKWLGEPDKVLSTIEVLESGLRVSDGWKHYIPVAEAVRFPEADLPIDPYTLGALLGDGGLTQPLVRITTMDDDLIENLVLPEGVTPKPQPVKGQARCWLLSSPRGQANPLCSAIQDLGLRCRSEHKRIPEMYLRGSVDQRWSLLQGLLDTDGYCGSSIEFYSTSLDLAEGVIELVRSLGGTASLRTKPTPSLPCHIVRMVLPPERCPFRIQRKVAQWTPRRPPTRAITSIKHLGPGEATCITVSAPDSLFLAEGYVATHNSHLAMAISAMLYEDGLIDQVLVVAEANKVLDWVEDDFPTYTDLTVKRLAGTIKQRQKMLADPPQVMVCSYETGRNDICEFRPKSSAVLGPKMLTEALTGKRVAIIFDEFSRLRTRSSKTYIAWDYLVNRVLRKTEHQPRLVGLTATTVESSPEDHWNAGRLLAPGLAGSVASFEENYIRTRDIFTNKPATFKHLTPQETPAGVVPLNQMFASITLRKRKTDPDVIDLFPAKMENPPTFVELGDKHKALYDQVEEIFADEDLADEVSRQGFGLLRQIAGHPMSLLRAEGQFAKDIVDATGMAFLEEIGCAKVQAMLEWQARMAGQQTVIFTFYGGSILPYLEHSLRAEGYKVSVNHGRLDQNERKRQQDAYKAGDTQIFLSSDAGAKGLNLGVGSGLLHYEDPLLYSTFDQRSNRIHRIDSKHPSVTIDQLIVKDTVEMAVANIMLKRNEWAERVQDADYTEDYEPTERFLRAKDRLAMLRRTSG